MVQPFLPCREKKKSQKGFLLLVKLEAKQTYLKELFKGLKKQMVQCEFQVNGLGNNTRKIKVIFGDVNFSV